MPDGKVLHEDPIRPGVDFLLINAPPWLPLTPPLGPVCIASYLHHHDIDVQLLDLNIELFWAFQSQADSWLMENAARWSDPSALAELMAIISGHLYRRATDIVSAAPRLIGISVVGGKEMFILRLMDILIACGYHGQFILGGPALLTPHERLIFSHIRSRILAFVIGEGEAPCLQLIRNYKARRPSDIVPGAVLGKDDAPHALATSTGQQIPMDDLPYYNPTFINEHRYVQHSLLIEWTRGCVKRCNFCEIESIWGRFRTKSAAHRLAEIASLFPQLQCRSYNLADPAINGSRRVLLDFCELVRQSGLAFHWGGHAIASKVFTEDDYRCMKEAGCTRLEFGVESGSDHVLDLMNKNTPVPLIERNLRDSKNAGIYNAIFLLVGYPGETAEDFKQTIDFVVRNSRFIDEVRSVNALAVQRNTALFADRDSLGLTYADANVAYRDHVWKYGDSNDLEERQRRVRTLVQVVADCGIAYGLCAGVDEMDALAHLRF